MPASTWSTTDKSANTTLSGSNLIATAAAANVGVRGKDPKRTGKYYIEYTSTTTQGTVSTFGLAAAKAPLGASNAASSIGPSASAGAILAYDTFGIQISGTGSMGGAVTTSSLVCCAVDLDNQLIWFRLGAAGNWNNSGTNNPATAVGGVSLARVGVGLGFDCYPFLLLGLSTNSVTANFGGSAFTGAVPAGFTSGWDDSVTVVTNMIANQIAIEEWASVAAAPPSTQNIGAMVLA